MTAFCPADEIEGVKANALKKMLGMVVAHDAMMLDDAQRVLADGRALNRAHHDRLYKMGGFDTPKWEEGSADGEDDDMSIHVGDIYQNINVPGERPSAVVEGKAGVSLGAAKTQSTAAAVVDQASRWKSIAAVACLCGALLLSPAAYAELVALFSGAAEVKVLWDGKEISPGESATGTAEQSVEKE